LVLPKAAAQLASNIGGVMHSADVLRLFHQEIDDEEVSDFPKDDLTEWPITKIAPIELSRS
jgi:hypothetical protein